MASGEDRGHSAPLTRSSQLTWPWERPLPRGDVLIQMTAPPGREPGIAATTGTCCPEGFRAERARGPGSGFAHLELLPSPHAHRAAEPTAIPRLHHHCSAQRSTASTGPHNCLFLALFALTIPDEVRDKNINSTTTHNSPCVLLTALNALKA